MENYNPYAIPDDDVRDILDSGSDNRRHMLDGTSPCNACGGVVHNIVAPSDLPSEVLDALSNFLDGMPGDVLSSQIIIARSTPDRSKVIADFMEFSKILNEVGADGPLIRAIAEVVDEMSGGKVERLWRVYQSERELLIAHTVLKAINTMKVGLEGKKGTAEQGADDEVLWKLLEQLQNSTMERIGAAVERYRFRAGETGVAIDEQLIETGTYSPDHNRSRFTDHTMSEPIATEIGVEEAPQPETE